MKIVVIGGSGLIGSKLVKTLRAKGHEALPASPASGVDTFTGEGLAAALAGARVVVDVANSPSFEDEPAMTFFRTSGRNLLAAEAAAGVGHHVALSVVGTDRLLESGYFRAKMAQEALIEASGISYSILRSTQFFEFVDGIAEAATIDNEVHMAPVAFQPIAAADVSSAVARVAMNAPLNGRLEIAGPEPLRFDDVIRRRLSARHDPRQVIVDPQASYYGSVPSEDSLVPLNGAQLGQIRYEDWLDTAAVR